MASLCSIADNNKSVEIMISADLIVQAIVTIIGGVLVYRINRFSTEIAAMKDRLTILTVEFKAQAGVGDRLHDLERRLAVMESKKQQ